MDTIRRGALEIDLPDGVSIVDDQPPPSGRRGPGGLSLDEAVAPSQVAEAFGDQLTVVDTVSLRRDPAAPTPDRRGGGGPVPTSAVVRVDVGADEHAVALVEQEGYYTWVTGNKQVGGGRRRGPAPSAVTFEIPLDAGLTGESAPRRGPITDALVKPVTTIVFRFLARLAIGQLVKRLERSVEPGFVTIDQADPVLWTKVSQPSALELPTARRARVLLLVHGTFSSTRGGFGSFIATESGRRFVERAVAEYDLVLGFDHRTLSEDPLENAQQLLEQLRALDGAGIDIDVITHSRGALVVRSLVEHLLDVGDNFVVRKVVMVAGPNGGTLLAHPDNWDKLIDLYTNLVVAACRVIALAAPPAATVTTVLRGSLEALAILVKAIVAEAADEQRVPGLAAMVPRGSFIAEINRGAPPGQPISAGYYAVSSDFEVSVRSRPQALPAKLIGLLTDGFVDRLMGEANDLVVDVKSMTAVDPSTPGVIRHSFALDDNPQIHHCAYFVDGSVVQAIGSWLLGPGDGRGGEEDTAPPVGQIVYTLPDFVDTDFAVIDADLPLGVATRRVRASWHDFAVVRNLSSAGEVEHYAFTSDELMALSAGAASQNTLSQTGMLADTDASAVTSSLGYNMPLRQANAESPWAARTVVLLDGSPIGVAPSHDDWLLQVAGHGAAPDEEPVRRRGRSRGGVPPVTTRGGVPSGAEALDVKTATVQAYFRAETDAVVSTAAESLVLVDISLEALEGAVGPSAEAGQADIDTVKPITVHVVPRINLMVNGDKHATVPPPTAGKPQSLRFSVIGAHTGPGQLLVIAGQGPLDLVKLVLDVTVVEGQSNGSERAGVTAALPPAPDAAACDQLIIDENTIVALTGPEGNQRETVVQTRFDVRYQSESLDIVERAQTNPIKGDRLAYVTELYRQIEDDWGSSNADVSRFNRALRAYGGQLFDELLPESIQRQLWDNRDRIKQIQVNSIEPLIPWEVVHLKGPNGKLPSEELFLANMGLVRWIDGARYAPRQVAVNHGRVSVLTPSYPAESGWPLAEPVNEYRFLEKTFGATQVEADIDAIMSLIEQPGQFDLLHFAGHGMASSSDISNAGLVIQVRRGRGGWEPVTLTSTMVEQFANLRDINGNRPLVFLNACQVGRAAYQLTKIGGFAQAFLKGGAGIFVSTLWSVVDEPARKFGEKFYGELIAGKTVAQAAVAARQSTRAADDPTWLAYVVYGRPDGRLILQ